MKSVELYRIRLLAFSLMDNHFHLLIQTPRANLAEFMHHLNLCYTGWFNHKHGRSGHLFQGRYKAFLIDADNYLMEVSRYLHLNKARARGVKSTNLKRCWQDLQHDMWSSLPGYFNTRKQLKNISYEMILEMVGSRRAYRKYVLDGLRHGVMNPFDDVRYRIILGDDDFVELIRSKYIQEGSLREQPSYRTLVADLLKPEAVLSCVKHVCGVADEDLACRWVRGNGVVRGIAAELLYQFSALTQSMIGSLLGGIDYGGVHQLRRRLVKTIEQNTIARKKYEDVERELRKLCSM
jgi:REP element-mobilizing transposase RayT